jgi:hypothetical protein
LSTGVSLLVGVLVVSGGLHPHYAVLGEFDHRVLRAAGGKLLGLAVFGGGVWHGEEVECSPASPRLRVSALR